MPWDTGGVPRRLDRYLRLNRLPGGRALVPGCGSGYEAARLADAGMQVLAIDFSPAAVDRARRITSGSGARILLADFFDFEQGTFDLIYERAFMCALPPGLRRAWADRCGDLLNNGGRLAGFFFTDPTVTDGPPFGISRRELDELMGAGFQLKEDRPTAGTRPVFAGRERWQVWERRR